MILMHANDKSKTSLLIRAIKSEASEPLALDTYVIQNYSLWFEPYLTAFDHFGALKFLSCFMILMHANDKSKTNLLIRAIKSEASEPLALDTYVIQYLNSSAIPYSRTGWFEHYFNAIGTAPANSEKFRGIRPRMNIEDFTFITRVIT